VFSGQSLGSWRIVGQRYLSTRLSKGWQRSLLAVNRARRGKAAGHRPVLRGFPENVRNPDLPGVILVDDLDLACFVQVPQANCAGKQILWLRVSEAAVFPQGRFKYGSKTWPLCSFSDGRRHKRTSGVGSNLSAKNLSSGSTLGYNLERLEAYVLFNTAETKAANLERAYDSDSPIWVMATEEAGQ